MPSEQRVTSLELFFDLVFVFAITQVTGFISEDPTWTRLFEGLAILAALWWAWVSYAWLANTANSDEGVMRVVLLAAMGAMLIASLAVGHYDEHLAAVSATALTGGIALYLFALSAFRKRNVGSFNPRRLAAGALLVAFTPLAVHIPSLAALALAAVVTASLIAYEALRFADARDRIRHGKQITLR